MNRISAAQAIRDAVEAEQAAALFYRCLAHRTTEPAVRKFFLEMEAVEQQHGTEIETMGTRLLKADLPRYPSAHAQVVESAPSWSFAGEVTLEEGLQIALECEIQASLFYDALADQFDGAAEKFFRALAKSESQHAEMVSATIEKRSARPSGT